MSTNINTDGNFSITTTTADKASLTFNGAGDVILNNPARKSSGRALAPIQGDVLVVNYANDFSGGVQINGLSLKGVSIKDLNGKDLPVAPKGVNTFDIVMDAKGKLYKKD